MDQGLKPVVPCISLEPKEEKEETQMTPKLRVGFKEKQRKHLSEALSVIPRPAKKSCLEDPHEEPVSGIPMVHVSHSDTVRPYQELVVRPSSEDACLMGDEALVGTPGGNAKEKDAPTIPSS